MTALSKPLLSLLLPWFAAPEGWLGVYLSEGPGAVVAEVAPGSPAAAAGLQAGDQVLSCGGVATADGPALAAAVRARRAGERVALVVRRQGRELTLHATLGERPEMAAASPAPTRPIGPGAPAAPAAEPRPGAQAAQPRGYLGLAVAEADGGLRIERVLPDGPAAHAEVRAGERLRTVAGHPVTTLLDLDRALATVRTGQQVELGTLGPDGVRSRLVEVATAPDRAAAPGAAQPLTAVDAAAGAGSRSQAPGAAPLDLAGELAALRAELATLRAEVQELRRELAQRPAVRPARK
ncbi:MAG: PDZ domain-containing protein [Planctomycetes bacterium]|nr:PDZ domain-containing protein [Planctomycetota bacterium]